MSDQHRLNIFLRAHGVKHFAAREIVQLGRERDGVALTPPPASAWRNILPTLHVLEAIRLWTGPIEILSGYRNPAYNKAVGGADDSMHTYFNALDWRPVDFEEWHVAELEDMVYDAAGIAVSRFMGLGVYHDPNPNDDHKAGFIHLDTRGLVFGRPAATWQR